MGGYLAFYRGVIWQVLVGLAVDSVFVYTANFIKQSGHLQVIVSYVNVSESRSYKDQCQVLY